MPSRKTKPPTEPAAAPLLWAELTPVQWLRVAKACRERGYGSQGDAIASAVEAKTKPDWVRPNELAGTLAIGRPLSSWLGGNGWPGVVSVCLDQKCGEGGVIAAQVYRQQGGQ